MAWSLVAVAVAVVNYLVALLCSRRCREISLSELLDMRPENFDA